MPGNNAPLFSRVGNIGGAPAVTAANTAKDGTGTTLIDNIAERLARLNRKQRRGVIARAKKQARAAARKERGNK